MARKPNTVLAALASSTAFALATSFAFAQGMSPSGLFTPGHTVRCANNTCTVLTDAGGAGGVQNTNQGLTELSLTNTGLPHCIYDAPLSTPGGYHRLCFGANVNGGGALFSYDAIGASSLPWQIEKDGIFYDFPFTGGNVVGPGSSLAGNIACFNNSTGNLLKDCGVPPNTDVRQFGAKCDWNGTTGTDDLAAFLAALSVGGGVAMPSRGCRISAGITITNNTNLFSFGAFDGVNPGGAQVVCDLAVTPCVTLANNDSTTPALSNVVVTRAPGTIPTNSQGILVKGAYNVPLENVTSTRSFDCFTFQRSGATGISAHANKLFTAQCTGSHIVDDSWPELYVMNSRLGGVGATDSNGLAYVTIKGIDPNTIVFDGVQFNLAGGFFVDYWLNFTNMATTNAIFKFSNGYVENVGTAHIRSDAATVLLERLQLSNMTLNAPTKPFLALNAATQISQWEWGTNEIFCSDFTLAPTLVIDAVTIGNSHIHCPISVTGAAASVMLLNGITSPSNLTVAGGPWTDFDASRSSFGGTITNNATGVVLVPGAWKAWTPNLFCGGGTIATQSNTGKFRWLDTKTVVFEEKLSTADIGSCVTNIFSTLPTASAQSDMPIPGYENTNTGKGIIGRLVGTSMALFYVDNTLPIQNNNTMTLGGTYEVNAP